MSSLRLISFSLLSLYLPPSILSPSLAFTLLSLSSIALLPSLSFPLPILSNPPSPLLLQFTETDERIDYSKLKTQERIYFYDEVILYEDELADNGTAVLSVKIVSLSTSGKLLIARLQMNSLCRSHYYRLIVRSAV